MIPPTPRRTWFTNLVGAAAVLLGGAGALFSAFALLLSIGKPYANSASDPLGIFLIFILPPGTLLAGICLLLRRRWARWWMILLMVGLIALGVKGLVAPTYQNPAYAPKLGPAAAALHQRVIVQSTACISIGTLLLLGLFSAPVRREFQSPSTPPPMTRQWRVGHQGRDMMYYEELHDGTWQRLEIDGEMLTGRAHHVIYFASEETWQGYPQWVRGRRGEIIARIKSRFSEPDYEYHDSVSLPPPLPLPPAAITAPLPKRDGSILPMLLFLLAIATASFWFAAEGVKDGEVRLPVKQNPASRSISRSEKPALFWTSISLVSSLGTGCTGLAAWLVMTQSRRR
jgi:hypothetical protein